MYWNTKHSYIKRSSTSSYSLFFCSLSPSSVLISFSKKEISFYSFILMLFLLILLKTHAHTHTKEMNRSTQKRIRKEVFSNSKSNFILFAAAGAAPRGEFVKLIVVHEFVYMRLWKDASHFSSSEKPFPHRFDWSSRTELTNHESDVMKTDGLSTLSLSQEASESSIRIIQPFLITAISWRIFLSF